MNEETKKVLKKRVLSFLWRLGGMSAVATLSFVANQAELLHLPNIVVVLLGLGIGELSKYLNVDKAKVEAILGSAEVLCNEECPKHCELPCEHKCKYHL